MKKILLVLSAAGCLVLPAITHADTYAASPKKAAKASPASVATAKAEPDPNRLICYITPTPCTGSLIPMVYRRYNGRVDSASNAAVYGSSRITSTGALDVAAVLTKLDSSISMGSGRR